MLLVLHFMCRAHAETLCTATDHILTVMCKFLLSSGNMAATLHRSLPSRHACISHGKGSRSESKTTCRESSWSRHVEEGYCLVFLIFPPYCFSGTLCCAQVHITRAQSVHLSWNHNPVNATSYFSDKSKHIAMAWFIVITMSPKNSRCINK